MTELDKEFLAEYFANMAKKMAEYLIEVKKDPEYISQNKAYKMFGRGNIDRWKKMELISPCIRKGKMEYKTSMLRNLQDIKQDYFDNPSIEQLKAVSSKNKYHEQNK